MDLAPRSVKVTTIHPGFVRTAGTANNPFRMPFLLELDDAVERIGLWDRAVRRFDPGRGS